MAISFDGATRRIVLDQTEHSAEEIWSRWVDWHASNPQWPVALSQVGGDDLGDGLFIPIYIFEQNGWRVRPKEANHNLRITGNLFVAGGGIPVVPTLGSFQVNVNYTVPVQAQAMSTTGGTGGMTAEQALQLAELWRLAGLDLAAPLTVTETTRLAGDVEQSIAEVNGTVTVTRQ